MKHVGFLSLLAVMITTVSAVAGPKWDLNEDKTSWMQLSILGQVHYANEQEATLENDVYLRRARIILAGQIQDGVKFFLETDNDNAGKSGTSVSTDIQDIFLDVRLLQFEKSEHWVKAGLVLLPFSFETRASAASLLGLDYNVESIKLANTFVWRDYGAELHGHIGDRFSYAMGAFDGYDVTGGTKNPDAGARLTGHLAFNLLGKAENGWFFTQERLPKESYLSLGLGGDSQRKATLTTTPATEINPSPVSTITDSSAWVVDMQSGFAIKENISLTLNGAYYTWDNASFKGNTISVETGLRVSKTMVTGKYAIQDPDAADKTEEYTAGLHYFLKGHNARCGVEYRWGDTENKTLAGFQFLL